MVAVATSNRRPLDPRGLHPQHLRIRDVWDDGGHHGYDDEDDDDKGGGMMMNSFAFAIAFPAFCGLCGFWAINSAIPTLFAFTFMSASPPHSFLLPRLTLNYSSAASNSRNFSNQKKKRSVRPGKLRETEGVLRILQDEATFSLTLVSLCEVCIVPSSENFTIILP